MSSLSTEKQSRKEDAKNSDDESKLNESTEQMVKGEEVRVVPPTGGHRRRRPQTMRKHTNARQRNRRISSSDDESSKDDKNEDSVESTQSISVSHSKVAFLLFFIELLDMSTSFDSVSSNVNE
ncbi:unnamed protein product [Anisakis simplex]|uniref:Uncharacterized protein n=1 Tax=Anisakis simplex TaxID=6269 RepID=A0A3P6NW56_ANISI|nr:unnamed protein product [Anisakis simplex]